MTQADSHAWLGGRLRLRQPSGGHRVGADAALLAAAIAWPGGHVVDAGAGIGAAGLAAAMRAPELRVTLLERDPALADLARQNAAENGFGERAAVAPIDLCRAADRRAAGLTDGSADGVLTNPPFFSPREVRASPDAGKARAHVLDGDLAQWVGACAAMLAPGGRFVMIHRADALAACLAAAEGKLGALRILPVYPRAGAAATRLLLQGRKGSRAKPAIAPGLILHQADGGFAPQADALFRGEAWLDWGGQ